MVASCLHFPAPVLDLQNTPTSSLSLSLHSFALTDTWTQNGRASQTAHTRAGTSQDDCHYSASSKYSNSIRGDTKGLIRADEPASQVPFFLLLLIAAISGCVGKMPPDNSPFTNEPILCVCAWRGDVPSVGVKARTPCGTHMEAECEM